MGSAWSEYCAPLAAAANELYSGCGGFSNAAAAAACAACAAVYLDLLGARYRAKMAAYYAAILVNGCIMMPMAAATPFRVENMLIGAALMKPVSWWIGLEWEVTGNVHHLTSSPRPFVIVVNHQHSIDVLGLFRIWPAMARCTVVAKRALVYAGTFGPCAWLAGTTFIDRARGPAARRALSEAVRAAAARRVRVLVFPEGTRHHDAGKPGLLPFKSGAFAAAAEAKVPVLPIVFSHYDFLDTSSSWHPRMGPGKVRVTVLDPVEALEGESAQEMADRTREIMLRQLLIAK